MFSCQIFVSLFFCVLLFSLFCIFNSANIFAYSFATNYSVSPIRLWSNRTIRYAMDDLEFEPQDRQTIERTIDYFEAISCVRFVRFSIVETNDRNASKIIDSEQDLPLLRIVRDHDRRACATTIGMQSHSAQILSINTEACLVKTDKFENESRAESETTFQTTNELASISGRLAHELMHTLGFAHEHQRTDRDRYVSIVPNNIVDHHHNWHHFERSPVRTWNEIGPYDFDSIMHYGVCAFARSESEAGRCSPTIIILNQKDLSRKILAIGQRLQLSPLDIVKLNLAYQCN